MPDIIIKTDNTDSELTRIDGDLAILSGMTLNAPNLTHIEGHVKLCSNATLHAPNLTYIAGNFLLYPDANFNAPNLTHVNGLPLPDEATARRNLTQIAPLALATSESLDMKFYHCGTSHCIAGWAQVAILGKEDVQTAHSDGTHLLGLKAARYFFSDNDTARQFLRKYL